MKNKNVNIKRRVNKKRAGFTLMELLIAMSVMLLFTIIMTSLMDTATIAYQKSINCSNADVFISNTVNRLRLELSDARNVSKVEAKDFTGQSPKCTITTGGYTPKFGVVYTDSTTGAECLIFVSNEENPNLYVSKYGEVNPLVFTTDDLALSISSVQIKEKTIVFNGVKAQKGDTTFSSLDEITVKLK